MKEFTKNRLLKSSFFALKLKALYSDNISMNLFKSNLDPINQQTFQRHIKLSIALHLAFMLVFFIFREFAGAEIFRYGMYVITCLYLVFAMYAYHSIHPTRRFKDIYEGEELKTPLFICVVAFPLLHVGLMAHLYFKNKSDKPAPKILTHYGYFSLMILPLLGLSLINPKVAYWTAGPAAFYVIKLSQNTNELFIKSEHPPKTGETFYKSYLKTKSDKVSSIEILILSGFSAKNLEARREAESALPNVDKDDLGQKYGRMLVHDVADALIKVENSKLQFTDYSIVQWVCPSAALEIFLISSVDEASKQAMSAGMAKIGKDIVASIEKKISSAPIEKKAGYQRVLQAAKSDLSKSANYRSIASEK